MTPAEALAAERPVKKPRRTKTNNLPVVWECTIRSKRVLLRLSQAEVADAIGISRVGYWSIEGGSELRLVTATKIAAFFGCPIAELWPKLVAK